MLEGAILSDEEVDALAIEDLQAYFKPCLDALELPEASELEPRKPRFDCPPNHTVYFIQGAGGAIKIGFTQQDLSERLKCLQTGSPVRLVVLGQQNAPKKRERFLHKRFAAHRLHGEWFEPHPDILAEIERLNA